MTPLRTFDARAVSLPEADVDTDIIYPARFLLITEKAGLGRYAFHDRRDQPGFPLAELEAPDTEILVCGPNFGSGSSREQAVWALAGLGFRVVIAPSFGEIFRGNCAKNGVLAIRLPEDTVLVLQRSADAGERFAVDLEQRMLSAPSTEAIAFDIDEETRESLLNGWDETARIRALFGDAITIFEQRQRAVAPWLWTADDAALSAKG